VQESFLKELKMDQAAAESSIWEVSLLLATPGRSMSKSRVFSATKSDVTAHKDHDSFMQSK